MGPLAQLLSSFSEVSVAYTLARLEFAMHHPTLPAPPLLHRLPDPTEGGARDAWDDIERSLERARSFAAALDDRRRRRALYDPVYAGLERTLRELDRYARAVRWTLTVEERGWGGAG